MPSEPEPSPTEPYVPTVEGRWGSYYQGHQAVIDPALGSLQQSLLDEPADYLGEEVTLFVYVPPWDPPYGEVDPDLPEDCPAELMAQVLLGVSDISGDDEIDSNNWDQYPKSRIVRFVIEDAEAAFDDLGACGPPALWKMLLRARATVRADVPTAFTITDLDFVRNLNDET